MIASLTDALSRRGKIILAIWLVLFLVMVPPALKSLNEMNMSYEMAGAHDDVIDRYFDTPYYDIEKMPLLVVNYETPDGFRQLSGNESISLPCYTDYVIQRFNEDENWAEKLDGIKGRVLLVDQVIGENHGAIVLGFNYIDKQIVEGDTPELRSAVKEFTDDYMYELYERECHFNTYVTGDDALSYDFGHSIAVFAVMAMVIFIIVALILIGLYFGSVMSAIIPAVSMILSATLTNTIILGLCSFFEIWILSEIVIMIIVLALSFVFSILIVSNYRKEIFVGNGNAIVDAVVKSKKPIFATVLFFFLSGVFLLFMRDFGTLVTIGMVIIAGSISVFIVTFTVPASLITLTKNELFWMRTSDRKFKFKYAMEAYTALAKAVDKMSSLTDRLCTRHAVITVLVVLVATIASSACIVSMVDDRSSPDDISTTIHTGESLDGMNVMDRYYIGGIATPYSVVVEFDKPVAHIVKEANLLGNAINVLYWGDEEALYDMWDLQDEILQSDVNIFEASSVYRWNTFVIYAKNAGMTEPEQIIDYILSHARRDVSEIISREINGEMKLIPAQLIVDYMGPRIDLVLNMALGSIGYEMKSDGQILVEHIRISAYTEKCATTSYTMKTTKTIQGIVDAAPSEYTHISSAFVTGMAVDYHDSLGKLHDNTLTMVLGILAIFFIVIFAVWTGLGSVFVLLISSIASLVLTGSLSYLFLETFFPDNLSQYMVLVVPLASQIVAMWFGFVMVCIAKECKDTYNLRRHFIPMTVITAVTVICTATPFLFSSTTILIQISMMFIIVIAFDVLLIRMFLMPSLLSILYGRTSAE